MLSLISDTSSFVFSVSVKACMSSINSSNNGNGVIDAGETVRLYISLHNRGGVASEVNVSIDTSRGEGLSDPYFTFVNSTL